MLVERFEEAVVGHDAARFAHEHALRLRVTFDDGRVVAARGTLLVQLAHHAVAARGQQLPPIRAIHAQLSEVPDVFSDAIHVQLLDRAARDADHALAVTGDEHLRRVITSRKVRRLALEADADAPRHRVRRQETADARVVGRRGEAEGDHARTFSSVPRKA